MAVTLWWPLEDEPLTIEFCGPEHATKLMDEALTWRPVLAPREVVD